MRDYDTYYIVLKEVATQIHEVNPEKIPEFNFQETDDKYSDTLFLYEQIVLFYENLAKASKDEDINRLCLRFRYNFEDLKNNP